jgi:hypothetical protein
MKSLMYFVILLFKLHFPTPFAIMRTNCSFYLDPTAIGKHSILESYCMCIICWCKWRKNACNEYSQNLAIMNRHYFTTSAAIANNVGHLIATTSDPTQWV